MKKIIAIDIPVSELLFYKDYVNYVFINENRVYNICRTEEDVMKSNQWFKNLPLQLYSVEIVDKIEPGEWFITECVNKELTLKPFRYIGKSETGVDLIVVEDKKGNIFRSTKYLIEGAMKLLGEPTMKEKEDWVLEQNK